MVLYKTYVTFSFLLIATAVSAASYCNFVVISLANVPQSLLVQEHQKKKISGIKINRRIQLQ